jgi:hypothetical protein
LLLSCLVSQIDHGFYCKSDNAAFNSINLRTTWRARCRHMQPTCDLVDRNMQCRTSTLDWLLGGGGGMQQRRCSGSLCTCREREPEGADLHWLQGDWIACNTRLALHIDVGLQATQRLLIVGLARCCAHCIDRVSVPIQLLVCMQHDETCLAHTCGVPLWSDILRCRLDTSERSLLNVALHIAEVTSQAQTPTTNSPSAISPLALPSYQYIGRIEDCQQVDRHWLGVHRILVDLKDVHHTEHDCASRWIQRLHRDDAHILRKILCQRRERWDQSSGIAVQHSRRLYQLDVQIAIVAVVVVAVQLNNRLGAYTCCVEA